MTEDRGETIDMMQPMGIGEGCPRLPVLHDMAIELATKAAAFRSSLPTGVAAPNGLPGHAFAGARPGQAELIA